ncbi:MAG: DUF4405 domain-containing protein [Desulfobacterales bacterium]
MGSNKAKAMWIVNLISFVLFGVLSLSGLINWLILPRGPDAREGVLISLRHLIRDVHTWTALIFILIILVHLGLHFKYIKAHLKSSGPEK